MEREYIVSLHKGIDYEQFWTEMETTTIGHATIPEQAVDIIDARPLSQRNCHYALTEEQAARLRTDPRVMAVEIPPDQRTDIQIGLRATQTGVFSKNNALVAGELNWGLLRNNKDTNVFGLNTSQVGPYEYMLDGTGVDVVIQDSGIEPNHPEFFNYAGTQSRLQQINWYSVSGVVGASQSPNHYSDTHGHGTHVASTAVGLRHGWAKNARIYAVKVAGLEGGNGDSGTGIPVVYCFDVIKGFHLNKPIDPVTGRRRPTIVNMSWGYGRTWGPVAGGVYRGTPWTGTSVRTDFGMVGRNGRFPILISSVEVDMIELLDAGVHICAAAGNDIQKMDVLGGIDYDNYYYSSTTDQTPIYYHRGGSPLGDDRALCVGALDNIAHSAQLDRKRDFSNSGPAVNIFAVGSNVQAAASTTTVFSTVPYTPVFPLPPAPPPEPYNIRVDSLAVNSNSFISQNKVLTYNDYGKGNLGANILLGAEVYPSSQDAASLGVWVGETSNGNAYKIRYEGVSDFNSSTKLIIWEVTFWRNNWIEILVIRHDDAAASGTLWGLFSNDTSVTLATATLSPFRNAALQGPSAVPRSIVLSSTTGQLWNQRGNNSRVRDNGDGTFTAEDGLTADSGRVGLTPRSGMNADEALTEIRTPFDFNFFTKPQGTSATSNFREARISGTSMASPQVCGVGAQLLQLRPELTPAQLRDLLIEYSTPTVFDTGLNNDYTNFNTLHGAPVRVLRNPFGKPADAFTGQFQNGIQFRRK